MSEADKNILSRWSRRKLEQRQRDESAAAEDPAPEQAVASAAPDTQPEEISPEALPPIDSLTKDSDYTVFLRPEVSEVLRRRALRRLWRSDPVLANLDGLNDYDEDFRKPFVEAAGQIVRTLFRAGRGMISIEEAREEEEGQTERTNSEPQIQPPTANANAPENGESESSDPLPARVEAPLPVAPEKPEPPASTAAKPVFGSARKRRWGDFG